MLETEVNFKCPKTGTSISYLYQHSPKHRDGNAGKSQWDISVEDEASSFTFACQSDWLCGVYGWGLHVVNGKIAYLGKDRDSGSVFIAKFDNHEGPQWHGYPCDYRIDNQRPDPEILLSWVDGGYLKLAKMRKITKGQRCAI